jgi:hypothetical protein
MLIAEAEASQWVEATAPKVPRSSGRVVKAAIQVSVLCGWACSYRATGKVHRRRKITIGIVASENNRFRISYGIVTTARDPHDPHSILDQCEVSP